MLWSHAYCFKFLFIHPEACRGILPVSGGASPKEIPFLPQNRQGKLCCSELLKKKWGLTRPAFCCRQRGLGLNNSVSRHDILTICLSKIFKYAINVTRDRRWHCLINTTTEVTLGRFRLAFYCTGSNTLAQASQQRGEMVGDNAEMLLSSCLFSGK